MRFKALNLTREVCGIDPEGETAELILAPGGKPTGAA
jgi:hypothetical protein